MKRIVLMSFLLSQSICAMNSESDENQACASKSPPQTKKNLTSLAEQNKQKLRRPNDENSQSESCCWAFFNCLFGHLDNMSPQSTGSYTMRRGRWFNHEEP